MLAVVLRLIQDSLLYLIDIYVSHDYCFKCIVRKQPEAMWSQSMAVERFRLCNLETILEQARLAKSIGNARRTVTVS